MNAAHAALKRLLANGPLTGMPTRRDDLELLRDWLGTFSEPYGIDHVSLRRELVDARLLARDASGSEYRINARRLRRDVPEAAPADILAAMREDRAARKRKHLA